MVVWSIIDIHAIDKRDDSPIIDDFFTEHIQSIALYIRERDLKIGSILKIAGRQTSSPNVHSVRYDQERRRWYLELSALDVKEIRAKIWQHQAE